MSGFLVSKLVVWSGKQDNSNKYILGKVHIFWEGHKFFRNLHLTFDFLQSKVRWRFHKILWPYQKIWTLNIIYLVKSGATAFFKVSVSVVIIHIKRWKRHTIMTVQGVTSIAIIKILMVKSEGISFTAQSKGPFIYYLKSIFFWEGHKIWRMSEHMNFGDIFRHCWPNM